MRDMGLMHHFLRLEVWQGNGELFFSQGKYENVYHRSSACRVANPCRDL